MAWDICITADGWQAISDTLETWDRDALIAALVDDDIEAYEEAHDTFHVNGSAYHAERTAEYALMHESLIDEVLNRIRTHNTCDNGGNGYYIDREGWHKVYLPD
jgi:hypothetical protein